MYVIRVTEVNGSHTTIRFTDDEPAEAWRVFDLLAGDDEPTEMTMHNGAGDILAHWSPDA